MKVPVAGVAILLIMVGLVNIAGALGGEDAEGDPPGVELPEGLEHTLEDYRVGVLDPLELRHAARAGGPVHLAFQNVTFDLTLRLHNMRACSVQAPPVDGVSRVRSDCSQTIGTVDANGSFQPVDLPPPRTYRGNVLDADGSVNASGWAALNIHDDGVNGAIGDRKGAWFLQPLEETTGPGEGIVHVLYRDIDVKWPRISGMNGTGEAPSSDSEGQAVSSQESGASTSSTSSLPIHMAAIGDQSFVDNIHGGSTSAALQAIEDDVNVVAGVLENDLDRPSIFIQSLQIVPDSVLDTTDDAHEAAKDFRDYMNNEFWDAQGYPDYVIHWNFAHLWSGRQLDTDNCDGTDQSGCIWGRAVRDTAVGNEHAYSITQQADEWCYPFFPGYCPEGNSDHRRSMVAHEIGHTYHGAHCSAGYQGDQKTLMAQWHNSDCSGDDPSGKDYVFRFSDGRWASSNNNVKTMNGLVDTHMEPPAQAPPAPSGPSTAYINEAVTFTFELPQMRQNNCGFPQIWWGENWPYDLTDRMPGTSAKECGTFTRSHSWDQPGTYNVYMWARDLYLGPFGPDSPGHQITVQALTDVQITSVPSSVAPGDSFQMCWDVDGSGEIDHTNIHWSFNSGSAQSTGFQTGTAPASFCDTITAPNSEGTINLEAHAQAPGRNLYSASYDVNVEAVLTGVDITSAPASVAPGNTFQVCWSVDGAGDITHTNIHWNKDGGGTQFTTAKTGTAPASFCDSITAPNSQGTINLEAHAQGPNDNLYSTQHSVSVDAADDLTGVDVTSVPSTVGAGDSFQVCWSVDGSGSIDHTNIHWNKDGGSMQYTTAKTGTAPASFCDSITAPDSDGTIKLRAHARGPNDDLFTVARNVDVTGSGGGGGVIAQHDGVIRSTGQYNDEGTLITFSNVQASGDVEVTYKYCYIANTNGWNANIITRFDGATVDSYAFTTPSTGQGSCSAGDSSTFATRSFTVASASISNEVRFDFKNGDWRLEIAEILVTSGSGFYMEDFDDGAAQGWWTSGLWRLDSACEAPPSSPAYLGYHRASACDYDTGTTTSGSAVVSVDLSGASQATLSFDHFFQVESYDPPYDVMRVEVRPSGGQWRQLDQWDSTDATNGGWSTVSYDVSMETGGLAEVRFSFDSKDSGFNAYPGWYLDNVKVTSS